MTLKSILSVDRAMGWSGAGLLVGLALAAGCSPSTPPSATGPSGPVAATPVAGTAPTAAADPKADPTGEHAHKPGAHGGILVSLGRDSYHVEAIVTSAGELQLYTLGNDETRVLDVENQKLTAYVKPVGGSDSTPLDVVAQPQPGDREGRASLFVAKLPEALVGSQVDVTVPNITIEGERFRLGFTTRAETHDEMPALRKVVNEEERKLYLTPGGIYTQADIEANGNVTASEKFAGIPASHDAKPQPGDKLCPISLTKANAKFTWVIGGRSYEFCCPPCVDEFVTMAKERPQEVRAPADYVQGDPAKDTTTR
jgi:YHS domain-containing protein